MNKPDLQREILKVARENAIERDRKEREEWDRRIEESRASTDDNSERASLWLRHTRHATATDYKRWLDGHIINGGEISHVYQYNMPDNFLVAQAAMKITPLYGARSVQIIVPRGIRVEAEDVGHNNVYYMDGFTCTGGWAPLFQNT